MLLLARAKRVASLREDCPTFLRRALPVRRETRVRGGNGAVSLGLGRPRSPHWRNVKHPPGRIANMRTQVIDGAATASPRLERVAATGELERTLLETLPLTIGRNGDCDLQIESPKVSREHAVITEGERGLHIRDLGSTNGTSVNGQRIEEADLADGDIVVIADIQFTFYAGRSAGRRDTVTMPIGDGGGNPAAAIPRRLIRQIRRAHEMLTHRGVRCRVGPIIDLASNRLFGFQAGDPCDDPAAGGGVEAILATDCRLAEHLCYLNRLIVAEESLHYAEPTNLFVRLHQSEIGGQGLAESLESLAEILRGRHQLVVSVPAALVGVTSYFAQIRRRLSEIGALVAYDQFEANPAQLRQWPTEPPEFVKLAPLLVCGIGGDQQRRRLVSSLVKTAADLRIKLVASGIRDREDVEICRALGASLADGPVFGTNRLDSAFSAPPADMEPAGIGT